MEFILPLQLGIAIANTQCLWRHASCIYSDVCGFLWTPRASVILSRSFEFLFKAVQTPLRWSHRSSLQLCRFSQGYMVPCVLPFACCGFLLDVWLSKETRRCWLTSSSQTSRHTVFSVNKVSAHKLWAGCASYAQHGTQVLMEVCECYCGKHELFIMHGLAADHLGITVIMG